DDLPPTLLTALRAIVASAFLVVLLLRSGADAVRAPAPETVRAFFVLGVAGVVLSMHIAYWGIYTTTAANAAILQAASPVMIALGVLLYHAILGAIAHLWWYAAVERVGPSRAAIFLNVTPLVGMALAAALLGEPIGPWQIGGVALVMGGVALTTRRAANDRRVARTGGELGGSPRPPQSHQEPVGLSRGATAPPGRPERRGVWGA